MGTGLLCPAPSAYRTALHAALSLKYTIRLTIFLIPPPTGRFVGGINIFRLFVRVCMLLRVCASIRALVLLARYQWPEFHLISLVSDVVEGTGEVIRL